MRKRKICHHEWVKSWEECVILDYGAGEYTGMCPKWTCKKCGKTSWVHPNT